MSVGKSIRLYLTDGTPGGLLTAEIVNWTGHVVAAPRSDLGALLKRDEARRTGIYFLLGDDPDGLGGTVAYIGEADNVGHRLAQHHRPEVQGGKDFWDRVVVLTSKDANLTKAHARYLESRFISIAKQANRSKLTNSTAPDGILLPEADISDMEYFVAQARVILPVLGINILRTSTSIQPLSEGTSEAEDRPTTSPIFELRMSRDSILARAQEIDGEFTVLEDSQARRTMAISSSNPGYKRLRERLENDGTLVSSEDDRSLRFAHASVFASPSAAAFAVTGRSANGRNEWKLPETGTTFGEWQSQRVTQAMEGASA